MLAEDLIAPANICPLNVFFFSTMNLYIVFKSSQQYSNQPEQPISYSWPDENYVFP